MTSKRTDPSYGLPPPVTKLTVEQDLKMRIIKDRLNHVYEHERESIINLFLALQRQNFVLGNSLNNVLEKWNTIEEVASKFGHLLETKDSTST